MKTFYIVFFFILILPNYIFCQNIDSLYKVLNKTPDKGKAKIYFELCEALRGTGELEKSLQTGNKSVEFAQKFDDKAQMASALTGVGLSKFYLGKSVQALASFIDAKRLYTELNNKEELANILRNIGVTYKTISKYEEAVKNYQDAAILFEKVKNLESAAQCMLNIGNVYLAMKNNKKSMEYYNEALKVFERLKSNYFSIQVLNCIGTAYLEIKENDKALATYLTALNRIDDSSYVATKAKIYKNIADAYSALGQYPKALFYCNKAKDMFINQQNNVDLAITYRAFGQIYKENKQFDLALTNFVKAAEMMKSQEMFVDLPDVYKDISLIYQKKGNFEKALEVYQSFSNIKDSTLQFNSQQNTEELNFRFETEKKDLKFKEQSAQLQKSKIFIYAIVIVAVFILMLLFLAYNRYLLKKKANSELSTMNNAITEKNAEIITKNVELEKQKSEVEKHKEEILSSIHYASRIQRAILPPTELFDEFLSDHFILNKPRDIVSGDFYWLFHKNNKIIIAVADCTGHGVPGAFMSMLGISFLNEIASNSESNESDQILNHLREYVMASLRQTGKENEAKDGMDISLSIIDYERKIIQFSGANNPLYFLRGNELTTYKGDRMPIGIYFKGQTDFTKTEVEFLEGDKIYMCSDGYEDQFGGEAGRKFMSKRFKELLGTISDKDMKEQRMILNDTMTEWIGEREQIDDILVVGIKL